MIHGSQLPFSATVELVHADTHSDYSQRADGLLAQGYKDAAAVITGTSLEVHVRLFIDGVQAFLLKYPA
ncbi:hypothetical protein [Streptomyces griseoruber]|uniref:Uncharacterized protein n=1 Tax=Streptomyces griseoruber TaxID=1943 RepID=A0A101SVX5_9ACTN|nr:hypothetical protein [Streptomyces griseoruber]KUN81177.1 hypothetical protein AQJ64_22420 [Streptomyces griseoruber]